MPRTVDITRVERYELLKSLMKTIRRRRRMLAEYQALLARVVRTLAATYDEVELEVSVYDRLHDKQAQRFKEAMVSQRSSHFTRTRTAHMTGSRCTWSHRTIPSTNVSRIMVDMEACCYSETCFVFGS